jgi:hypothetical protein
MEAACLLAGDWKAGASAKAHGGGLFNFTHNNQRIQCIRKTTVGGNHHNHGVHPIEQAPRTDGLVEAQGAQRVASP